MKASESIKHLFVSQTRQKLVETFFYNAQEIYYVRQLVRSTGEEINSVRRELNNLSKAGIIISEARGNRLYYSINPDSQLYYDLLILAHKTTHLGKDLQSSKIGNLKLVLYSQSFLANLTPALSSSIDMLIIGDATLREVETSVKKEEAVIGREINYMVMDKNELKLRKQKRDPILIDFFLNCPGVVIGNPKDLENL